MAGSVLLWDLKSFKIRKAQGARLSCDSGLDGA